MNDEIKEILDYLKRSDKNKFGFEQGKLIDYEETQLLLNYITNLQKEKEDYKSRIEKAVEYIKRHIQKYDIDGSIGDFDEFDMLTKPNYLLNILQNGSEK